MAEFICYFTGIDKNIYEWDSRIPITPAQIVAWFPEAEKKGTRICDHQGFLYFSGADKMYLKPKRTYFVPETNGNLFTKS
jgi:hypothetical protein